MKSRNLILGVIILVVGVIALLSALDVVDFSWRVAIRLWPILLIFTGVLILPVKDVIKVLLVLATFALGILLYENEIRSDGDIAQEPQAVLSELVE